MRIKRCTIRCFRYKFYDFVDYFMSKVYKAISYKILKKVIIKCKNLLHKYSFGHHQFTYKTDYIFILLYMNVTHFQNKMLYNRVFFGTNFMVLLMSSLIQRTRPKLNTCNENPYKGWSLFGGGL